MVVGMSRAGVAVKAPEATRRKLLDAAFAEFYANGFQGGSLNHIVAAAGATKGALFHHFDSKQDLGYAVVDERIGPLLLERWLSVLEQSVISLLPSRAHSSATSSRTSPAATGCRAVRSTTWPRRCRRWIRAFCSAST